MAINKVIKKGAVELDLTSDTVTPETLMSGITAHNAAGETIIGTASSGSGGESIETCSLSTGVKHYYSGGDYQHVLYNTYEGNQILCNRIYLGNILPNSLISDNVVKNSFIITDSIYLGLIKAVDPSSVPNV